MIKQEKLLDQINELMSLEKSLIPLLNKHMSASLFFSNLKESEQEKIKGYFQNLVIAKTKQIDILNGVKDEVARRKKDVY